MKNLNPTNNLFKNIKELIEETKAKVTVTVNSSLTLMYWHIGKQIDEEILKSERAEYGKDIIPQLSKQLVKEFGAGYSKRNLANMVKLAQVFPNIQILQTLCAKLSWSHFRQLIYIEDNLKREFYIEMCRLDNWSVRVLQDRINSMLYERTALSKEPDKLIEYEIENLKKGNITPPMVLKDPYVLDFLELKDRYLEVDLEDAILREIEKFILELGSGFTFVERQKRVQIGSEEFRMDLLFYNRKLKRLILIELKLGKFKASYKGQVELYLKWLDRYEREEGEGSPIGIILCADKNSEQIELLELDRSNIHVAQYLTVLPAREKLEAKLQD
ncbi:MAG: PDDEXK nuclease domain-containing protein, partial [Epsilonproteobacteria bacterium]|nr:PDDEXK nuclease domain-containing protein [Campylobacterota bacterium]